MRVVTNDEIIRAISGLQRKLGLYLSGEGSLAYAELELAESLAEWYVTKGVPLLAERAREKQIATPVELDEFTVGIRWGGKDGKWRWIAEANDGQARAGEERVLDNAFVAAHRAVLDMQSPQP